MSHCCRCALVHLRRTKVCRVRYGERGNVQGVKKERVDGGETLGSDLDSADIGVMQEIGQCLYGLRRDYT